MTGDELLWRVCNPERGDIYAAPFRILLDGLPWACATDGHRILLLAEDDRALVQPAPDSPTPSQLDMVHKLIASAPAPAWQASHAALCAWAGTDDGTCPTCHGKGGPDRTDCADCDGEGGETCNLDHWHDCDRCNGTGTVGEPCPTCGDRLARTILPGVIDPTGDLFNRALFSGVVQHLPGDPVEIGVDTERTVIALHGQGWRLLVIGLTRRYKDDPLPVPLTLAPIPGAAAAAPVDAP